ncbi:LLM class flavin-dependent oxidoreductase [Amycolatopsis alkalitolerans]|nr:LLM class flavin-dependent oxidoreductase [Amycolatopsis alkalitolerans]
MTTREGLRLGLFLVPTGHHLAAWAVAGSRSGSGLDIGHLESMARTAERGRFDLLFLADVVGLFNVDPEGLQRDANALLFEPFTLLSRLSAVTGHIGLVASASTSYNSPFALARMLSSLDHLSGGRAGWNIVTSYQPALAKAFGYADQLSHDQRYGKAAEFVDVARQLWRSWGEKAVVADKSTRTYLDLAELHPTQHEGAYYSVTGALSIGPSPQGEPLLVQAGSSAQGRDFAARFAEVMFGVAPTLQQAQEFKVDIARRAAGHGRAPSSYVYLPGAFVLVGESTDAAFAKLDELNAHVDPVDGVSMLHNFGIAFDPEVHSLDDPFWMLPATSGQEGRRAALANLAREQDLSVRDVCRRIAVSRGHAMFVGSPEDIADGFERWYREQAVDGFNVMCARLPEDLDLFVEHVLPLLRARGLFPAGYGDDTLRGSMGLS